MQLQVSVEKYGDGNLVVRPVGDVDLATAAILRERLLGLLRDAPRCMVVALNQVDFLDSTGLGALVAASRRARLAGTRFCLAAPPGPVFRLLAITHLDQALAVYPGPLDAVRELALVRTGQSGAA